MAEEYSTPAYIENMKLVYPLLFICEYLSLNDLKNLSLVSKFLYINIVQAFYRYKYKVLEKIVWKNTNIEFYLPTELPLDDDLPDRSLVEKFALNHKLSRLCRHCIDKHDFYFAVPRYSRSWCFEHEWVFDDKIGREIFHLINVITLELNVEFKDVQKGKYSLKIRINLDDFREINYKSRGKNIFAMWLDEKGSHCTLHTIKNDVFKALKERRKRNKRGVTILGGNCSARNFDRESGFFDLVLEGIDVANTCSVKCYLQDEDTFHLSNLKFDYIELMPVFEIRRFKECVKTRRNRFPPYRRIIELMDLQTQASRHNNGNNDIS